MNEDLRAVADLIARVHPWREWWRKGVGTVGYFGGRLESPVELVECYDRSESDSYGYVTNSEAGMVFKVGDQFFKKEGDANSYGEPDFSYYYMADENGYVPNLYQFTEVQKRVRTVSEYY